MPRVHRRRLGALDRLRERLDHAGPDSELYAAIARQVTEQRITRDLSQRELAELCGTTQSAIARFEAAERPPRLDTLLRVARALDCELEVRLRPRTRTRRRGDGDDAG
ncbi:MAG: helix-turn-helix transcriptional regulator [Thermoleophilia bacterium]|nr:helix-turn-helix transcriptional regulator [Thermoleophilia bacterium]